MRRANRTLRSGRSPVRRVRRAGGLQQRPRLRSAHRSVRPAVSAICRSSQPRILGRRGSVTSRHGARAPADRQTAAPQAVASLASALVSRPSPVESAPLDAAGTQQNEDALVGRLDGRTRWVDRVSRPPVRREVLDHAARARVETVARCYRVSRVSLAEQRESRAVLLEAVEIQDHGTHVVALVEGEPLFELLSVDQVLDAMSLTWGDIEDVD